MGNAELHICTACGAGHVEIRHRIRIGYCRCEQIELSCPDCGASREGIFDEEDVERFERRPSRVTV